MFVQRTVYEVNCDECGNELKFNSESVAVFNSWQEASDDLQDWEEGYEEEIEAPNCRNFEYYIHRCPKCVKAIGSMECDECRGKGFYFIDKKKTECICKEP